MPSARLFFALPVPKAVRAALAGIRPSWDPDDREAWRWVEPHLYHLTLAFLGERSPEEMAGILAAGKAAAAEVLPFPATCRGAGIFPGGRKPPRILWAGLEPDPSLLALHATLSEQLRSVGFKVEAGGFHPHITLARRRQGKGAAAKAIEPGVWGAWRVEELVLMESKLGSGPPVYQRRRAWRLGPQL